MQKLIIKGKSIDAKVRLKGDLEDHWRSIHKMKLKSKFKGRKFNNGIQEILNS